MSGEWVSGPATSDDGRTVIVTGRLDVDKFRSNRRFAVRVEVTWPYSGFESDVMGMPDKATSTLMEQVTDALADAFRRDPVAVMTGIYTGAGERNWVFYTASTNIFGRKLNEALESFPLLPLKVYCENDPGWAEYDEMSEALPGPGE